MPRQTEWPRSSLHHCLVLLAWAALTNAHSEFTSTSGRKSVSGTRLYEEDRDYAIFRTSGNSSYGQHSGVIIAVTSAW